MHLDLIAFVFRQAVPFVDHHHQRAPGFEYETGDMRVLIGNFLLRIEYQHRHVGIRY